MVFLDTFYIVSEKGECLYSRSRSDQIDEQLFASLMKTLDVISQELSSNNLSSLVLNKKKYTVGLQEGFMFIASTSPKEKDDPIKKALKSIQKKFFREFPLRYLRNSWNGDAKAFRVLDTLLDKYFLDAVKDRMDNIF